MTDIFIIIMVLLSIGFFFGRICRRQIFSLMLAKSVLFFVMVAAKWSQIFVLSQKIGRGMLDFIFLVAKKVKLRDHIYNQWKKMVDTIFCENVNLLASYFVTRKKMVAFFWMLAKFCSQINFSSHWVCRKDFFVAKNARMRAFFGFATKKKTYALE